MTVVVPCNNPALPLPATQNTAPVLEFNCLYTHDIRRKQKRWQDGLLRFHTFNKRVMVYDPSRNFVGSAHWTAGAEVQQGDELTLDKEAVMVEVAESTGRTETDLTELRNSRRKPSSVSGSSPLRASNAPKPGVANATALGPTSYSKHRSLNALLGTPKGPHGKAALPTKSPFEHRHAHAETAQAPKDSAPSKRSRADRSESSMRIGDPNIAHSTISKRGPLWIRAADSVRTGSSLQDVPNQKPEMRALDKPSRGSAFKAAPTRSSSPGSQTQHVPFRGHQPIQEVNAQTSRRRSPAPGEQTSNSEHMSTVREKTFENDPPEKLLRLPSRPSKKRLLLCHDQLTKKAQHHSSTNADAAAPRFSEAASNNEVTGDCNPAQILLQARLDKIRKRDAGAAMEPSKAADDADVCEPRVVANDAYGTMFDVLERPQTLQAKSALELTRLDRILLPTHHAQHVEDCVAERSLAAEAEQEPDSQRTTLKSLNTPGKPKRQAGAPIRYISSPPKQAQRMDAPPGVPSVSTSGSRSKRVSKGFGKTSVHLPASLDTSSDGTSKVILSRPYHPPQAPDANHSHMLPEPDPWSREAFDLFTWRPPGWDEDRWCLKAVADTAA